MRQNLLVVLVVILLLISAVSLSVYVSNQSIARDMDERNRHGLDLIINQQVDEAVNFAENNISSNLAQSLLQNECQIHYYSRTEELKSNYASFQIEGEVILADIQNPYADSGCFVKINYGQGIVNNYSNEIKDKVLYLSFTNGGNFVIVPSKTTLEKKYWPAGKSVRQ